MGVDQIVEEELLALFGVRLGLAYDRVCHRQHFDGLRVPAALADLLLLVLVVRACDVDVGVAGEDQFRPTRRELTAPSRRAGLKQDGSTLRAARDSKRAPHAEPLPLVVKLVHLLGVCEERRLAV